jgi:6-phosphogluconolactonase (cycloisomerase 2 family)
MKRLILYAAGIILSAFTACGDLYNDAFSDVNSKVKYFSYVTTTSSLYSYEVLEDGSFRQLGSPVTGLTNPRRIAVHPSGDYLYVAAGGSILCYKTGDDGALNPLAPLVNDSISYENIAVHPSGKYLYSVSLTSIDIYAYGINPDGTLTLISTTTAHPTSNCYGLAIEPSGRRVFITLNASDAVNSYLVAENGDLTNVRISSVGSNPGNLVIHPSGKSLYCGGGAFWGRSILADGSLTAMVGSGSPATNILIHPANKYLYTTSSTTNFKNYNVSEIGSLVSIGDSLTVFQSGLSSIAAHPSGKYVYFADVNTFNYRLISYTSDAAGSLSFNTVTTLYTEAPVDIKICVKNVFGESE